MSMTLDTLIDDLKRAQKAQEIVNKLFLRVELVHSADTECAQLCYKPLPNDPPDMAQSLFDAIGRTHVSTPWW